MVLQRDAVSLDGRVAVVTGGGEGIGRGIAAGLAAFGARVAIWERNEATSERAAADLDGLSCVADVRDAEQVDAALATTIDALGVPTILVNNAGGTFTSPLLDTAPKGWDTLLRSNLTHVLLCTQRVARAMVDAAVGGSIINVTSIEGTRAAPDLAAYGAAKAGVISLTKTSALELARYGIRVNGLAPDVTLTEPWSRSRPRVWRRGPPTRCRWGAPVTSTRWPEPRCSSPPSCRRTSPARPCTSTAAPPPRVAGTTIRTTATTSSARAEPVNRRA
jgi:NAD(P)-dependent dehydrogenase (short-subunit alcohol dehydrogenase family)